MTIPPRPPRDELEVVLSLAAVGNYVISAGHLEATMCRLIEWMAGNQTPGQITGATARLPWTPLVAELRTQAKSAGLADTLEALLDAQGFDVLVKLRHSLIHGSVGVDQPPTIAINRRRKTGKGAIMLGSRQEIEQCTGKLQELNEALDALMPQRYRRVHGNLIDGVVGKEAPDP